jgi:hypothetical protein
MRGAMPLPFWAVALILAAVAPAAAKWLGSRMERRVRARSRQILSEAVASNAGDMPAATVDVASRSD